MIRLVLTIWQNLIQFFNIFCKFFEKFNGVGQNHLTEITELQTTKQYSSYFEKGEFIPLELPFKVRQFYRSFENLIILTTDFRVYVKGTIGENYFKEFTKLYFTNIKRIASGEHFNLLIDNLNNVLICGEVGDIKFNSFTKFDIINDEIKFISCAADVAIITKTNKLIICGNSKPFNGIEFEKEDHLSVLDIIPKNIDIKDLQIGYYHSILLDTLGNVYGSGENKNGQLGNTDENILKEYTKLNILFKVKKIATYTEGTLLLNYNNELFGSGENCSYQSGRTTKRVYEFTKIVLNENLIIKKLYHSDCELNIILTNDGFYGCGHKFGAEDGFFKLKYKVNMGLVFCKPFLWFDTLYMIESDEKINSKNKKDRIIYAKIFQQLLTCKNTDITIKLFDTSLITVNR